MPKSVLFISFYYPPIDGSGVQRSFFFTKYLPLFQWIPIVICCDDAKYFGFGYDYTILSEVQPQVECHRFPIRSPFRFRFLSENFLYIEDQKEKNSWIMERFVSLIKYPPIDRAFYWNLSRLPFCYRLIKKRGIDLIFSTSGPYSNHLTALILKRLTGKPWVADFRDPWTQNPVFINTGWRRVVDLYVEKKVLSIADKIVATTPQTSKDLYDLSPGRNRSDFLTIENGYDKKYLFSKSLSNRDDNSDRKLKISHVGLVHEGNVIPYFKALKKLGFHSDKILTRFVGGLAIKDRNWLNEHTSNINIEITNRVPHPKALIEMRQADILLLTLGNSAGWAKIYPGKMFEYMVSGTPILLIGVEGEASNLIHISRTGCFVHFNDTERICEILKMSIDDYQLFKERYYDPNPEVVSRYNRKVLTKRLVKTFNDTTN